MKRKFDFDTYFNNAARPVKGLEALQTTLGLKHVTKANYEPLYLDAKNKHREFAVARAEKKAALLALRRERVTAIEFLTSVRNYLTGFLGDTHSALWVPLGFSTPSLTLPTTDIGRCQMLENITNYFTQNPAHENAAQQYTAARAAELCASMNTAVNGVENGKFDARLKRDARDAALRLLDKKLADLRRELTTVLGDSDPRWLKFFDRIPGDPRTPEPVEDVTAEARPGIITLDWPEAARAARYKVLKQVVGVDAEPVLVATVEDTDAQITDVPAGARVKLLVVAANGVGDATPSEVIELQAA